MFWVLMVFCGYLAGRCGHRYVNVWIKNPPWVPHHWLLGLALAGLGLYVAPWLFFVGLGLFLSDARDCWRLRFFSPDSPPDGFWGFD